MVPVSRNRPDPYHASPGGPGDPEGLGLPPAAAGVGPVRARGGLRSGLYRHQGQPPRPENSDGSGPGDRDPLPYKRVSPEAAAGAGLRPSGADRGFAAGGMGFSGGYPEFYGRTERVRPRKRVSGAQHPLHPPGVRPGSFQQPSLHGRRSSGLGRPAGEPRHPEQRAPVGLPPPFQHPEPAPGHPPLLPFPRRGHRPLYRGRPVPPGDAGRPGDGSQPL